MEPEKGSGMKLWILVAVAFIALGGCSPSIPADTSVEVDEAAKAEALSIICDEWGAVLDDEYLNMYYVTWHIFSEDGDYAYIYYNVELKDPDGTRITSAGDTWVVFWYDSSSSQWALISSQVL